MDEEDQNEPSRDTSGDEALLQDIRRDFSHFRDYWRKNRENRQKNMRYLCGDPWEPEDRKEREGRVCISHDELNQYVNQAINNIRQNKRGIKAEAAGNGATDKTAELRQDLIRTIEYRSRAQDVYLRAAQDMFEGGYGFFRVSRRYVSKDSDDQEIIIRSIPNPDSVLYDPDCKEEDWSDAQTVFVLDPIRKSEFKRRWPNAEKTDFTSEDRKIAGEWLQGDTILVAEYWRVEITARRRRKGRLVEDKKVVQYITNGLEILEKNEEPGEQIPIPAMIGKERYVETGGEIERRLEGLVDLARDPQKSLAYLVSQEMEEAGQSPKVPYRGFVGAFNSDADGWENLNKKPLSYIQEDPVYDDKGNLLPRVMREQFVPNFQAYEVAKDACRRSIQAATGISPLPTAAQRNNEKSGVALEAIQQQEALGSYHFTAGFERGVTRAARIIESQIPVVYGGEDREIGLQRPDESRRVVRLNTGEPYPDPKTGVPQHFPVGEEEHDVTVSTGPSYESQRDAVDQFLDNLIANLGKLPVPPPAAAKLLALAIQMKDLGPKGDEMAEIISPTQQDQSGQLAGMQQQLQQQGALTQQMQGELQKLQLEKQGKVIDNEYRLQLERMKEENALAIAEIQTKSQALSERLETFSDMMSQFHSQAHDVATAAAQHEHDAGMQAQNQAHAQGMATQQQEAAAAQQAAAQPQPGGPQQ